MSRRSQRIVLLFALCVAASAAVGVGSYSSMSTERGVNVSVVDEESAYLGVQDSTLRCGNNVLFSNQFSGPITHGTVEITPHFGDLDVKGTNGFQEDFSSGSFKKDIDENVSVHESLGVHLTPVNGSADTVSVDISLSGPGFDVSTTVERDVQCENNRGGASWRGKDDDKNDEGKDRGHGKDRGDDEDRGHGGDRGGDEDEDDEDRGHGKDRGDDEDRGHGGDRGGDEDEDDEDRGHGKDRGDDEDRGHGKDRGGDEDEDDDEDRGNGKNDEDDEHD